MKQRRALEDTFALLAGSSITSTSRPGEQFPSAESEGQIKQPKSEQGHTIRRLIYVLALSILLFSHALPAEAQTEQFQVGYGDVISDGVPAPGAGNIEAGGLQDSYTFQATAGDEVIFDSISGGSGQFFWLLNAPDGAVLFDTFNADRRITMPQSGIYTLTVRGANPATIGTYSLRIMLVPAPHQFGINMGDIVSESVPASGAGNIETPGAVDTYTFDGVAGQGIIFDALVGNTGQFRVILFAPDGAQLFNGFYMDHQAGLPVNGVYSVRVEGLNLDSVGVYSFQLVPMAITQEFNISIGDIVSDGMPVPGAGNLEAPGALDVYYFQGAAGQSLIFDVLAGATGQFWALLRAPDGSTVFDVFFVDQQATLPQTGTYTLTVRGGQVTNFGTYSFHLLHVPPAAQEFNISIGDTVSDGVPASGAGNLEAPGAVDNYRFSGLAGQGMIFDELAGNTGLFRVILAAPDGTEVFNNFLVDQQVTLPQAGTYLLSVQGLNVASFGTYSFALLAVSMNSNPAANDDTAATDEDMSVVIDVLANDTDPDGDAFGIDNVTQPANGSVTNNGVNVTYHPIPDFHGADSFSYAISDGNGGTATAAVTVTVSPVNDVPIIDVAIDPIEADEGTVATRTFTLSDVDGDPLALHASSGEIDDLTGGNFQWRYLADDGPASISVTLTADDAQGGIASVNFDVSVHNVSPTATFGNITGPIAAPGSATLSFSDQADPSQADTVAGFLYSYDCTNSGVFEARNATSADFDCTYSAAGVYTARGRIEDKDGGFSDLFAEVTVEAAANNPPQAYDDEATTNENAPVTIDVLVNDADPDGDPLIIESVTQPANGVVVNNGNALIYTPNRGFHGADTFSYRVSDPSGAQHTAEVVVTVIGVAPTEPVTIAVQITHVNDDVNESGRVLITHSPLLWISSNFWGHADYLGLRFNGVDIPQGAIIEEAYLEVYSPLKGWFYFDVEFRADSTDHSAAFGQHNRPSHRSLTQAHVTQEGNAYWATGSWQRFIDIASVIQEVTSRGGWQSGNSLSLIAHSTGRRWGSIIFASYGLHPTLAPRLVVRYRQD